MTTRANFLTTAAGSTVIAAGAMSAPQLAFAAEPDQVAAATSGMTLTTIRVGGVDRLGVRTPRGIVDVLPVAQAMGVADCPRTVDDLVAGFGNAGALRRIVANAPSASLLSETAVEYGPLVGRPLKIVCVGLNYRAHLAESGLKPSAEMELFNKFNNTLNRHNGTVPVSHMDAKWFDYESELVIVIGKLAKDVPEADALKYVYGYAAGNDFSARDLQTRVTQWMTGKSPDHFAPIGPWLVTADQIPDPQTLQVQTYVNDEPTPRQDMNTSLMIWNCAQIISYTSKFITLQPGDIIFTGTPSGVILGYPKDKQVWLKPGDRVHTKISKLGDLRFSLT